MLNDRLNRLDKKRTNLKTEVIAGVTTFLAMAYILGVNPSMLSDVGMPATGVFFATAVSSGIACIIMGLLARYPVGLLPAWV
jgi:AGZA family xanthine/uracil permease-like MFS transporter